MAFGSTALRIATLVFLFIARIRFPASYSLIGVLRKRYGRDLVKEVRTLEKLDFKHKKAILDLDFLISCRKNSVFPKFLQFKVSNKQLRASKAYISCQKRLLNQEINNKQKAVKSIQQKVTEVKNSLNCKMSYIDYVHVCNTFLVSNNKNISKVKETQDKKLCNLLLRNMGNNSETCQDPDKVIFNFSSYNLSDHEKIVLGKGLSFAIPPKTIEYSEFLVPFEMLFRDINSLEVSNLNKECVKSRLRDSAYTSFKQVSKISEKNLSKEEVKALNNLVRNKDIVIQKADKGNNIVILNRSDYVSKLNKMLEDTSKFKRVNIEEGKALNHLIHMEERIIRLLKSLESQGEISKKGMFAAVLTNLSKALDCRTHNRLIAKLSAYGFDRKSLISIPAYLKSRKQKSRIGSAFSDYLNILFGAPLGFISGPILFIIFLSYFFLYL